MRSVRAAQTVVPVTTGDATAGTQSVEVPRQRDEDRYRTLAWNVLQLEPPGRKEFDNPALEWRRLFSELLGTFFLVLVGAGGGVVNAVSDGAISRTAAVTSPALMVMAIILFMGAISGAHLNPAVTLGFAARGAFPWRRVPGYIVVQLIGSTLACLLLWAILGKIGG